MLERRYGLRKYCLVIIGYYNKTDVFYIKSLIVNALRKKRGRVCD